MNIPNAANTPRFVLCVTAAQGDTGDNGIEGGSAVVTREALVPARPERWRVTGRGPILFVCDHASNVVPDAFESLGLDRENLEDHIAWDIGAAGVTRHLSELLDCPALLATVSRLVIDCNRDPDDWDSIIQLSEFTPVPGNIGLDDSERSARAAAYYAPYHDCIEATRVARSAQIEAVIAIHSFVPVYHGKKRPWHVGLIHNRDDRIAKALAPRLRADCGLMVGDNEPYAPTDGVYHTLSRHAEAHDLPSLMIEIRSDLIREEADQFAWARRLAPMLLSATEGLATSEAA